MGRIVTNSIGAQSRMFGSRGLRKAAVSILALSALMIAFTPHRLSAQQEKTTEANNVAATDIPKWPLPPLDKATREQRLRFVMKTQNFSTKKLGHSPAISAGECRGLLLAFKDPRKYTIIEPDITTQTMDDPRVRKVVKSCPDLYLDRTWIFEPRDTTYNSPAFKERSADARDTDNRGLRYTANFELYDLARYGAPRNVWAYYAEGAVPSCPAGEQCPQIYSMTNPSGYRHYYMIENVARLFNNKTCSTKYSHLSNTKRVENNHKDTSAYVEFPSLYGLALINHAIVGFSFTSFESVETFQQSPRSGPTRLRIGEVSANKEHICLFDAKEERGTP
jgi:hypothetical protein